MRVTIRFVFLAVMILLIAAACQSTPRTEYILEMTKEVTREVTRVVVVTATPGNQAVVAASPDTDGQGPVAPPTVTPTVQLPPPLLAQTTAPTIAPTPTVDPYPTPITEQIIVAEQLFEGGRMFYMQPDSSIWVMYGDPSNLAAGGRWQTFPDTWEEGMEESDPNITAPDGLYQPERGFGKLWRENEEVKQRLGWALEPERGHVTTYQYILNGEVVDGVFIPESEQHVIVSDYGDTPFVFSESDQTWGVLAAPPTP